MTLRVKLFALMGGLLALMVGAEWLLVDRLTRDLKVEVTAVATSVGKDIVKVLHPGGSKALELPAGEHRRVVVTTVQADGNGTKSSTKTWTTAGGASFLFLEGPAEKVRIPIPGTGVKDVVGRFRTRLVLGSLGIVAVGLLAAAFVAHRVTRPLAALAHAARTVGEGEFGARVETREGGEVGAAIASFNLMSSRLQALEREALALKEREHLGEMGEVARGMAHALRNPLHAVGLSVDELAARLPDDPDAGAMAAAARRQIAAVDGTIRSFLALAAGGGAEEEVDVRALAEEVALSAMQEARGRARVSVAPGGAVRLRAVGPELKAALHAVVVNAVEASPDGGEVVVAVGPRDGGGAAVTVEDEGPGIPEEVRARLFTPHVTTKPSGSGMGLFLAHRIATTRYGGSLALEARAPRGTRALLSIGLRGGSARA